MIININDQFYTVFFDYPSSATRALAMPVLTFAAGPTNSMRGAAYLSGKLPIPPTVFLCYTIFSKC